MSLTEATSMRQRILREATRLFTHSGYNAVSMREIAAACDGITKAALYYHFTDKEDLMVAILTEYLEGMSIIIASCRAAAPDARTRLTTFMQIIFAQPPEQRAIIRLGTQELANLSAQTRLNFGQLYQEAFIDPLIAIIAEGMSSGELRPADSHQTVWLLLGMMYPFFYPSQERQLDLEAVMNLMIRVFFDGLAARD